MLKGGGYTVHRNGNKEKSKSSNTERLSDNESELDSESEGISETADKWFERKFKVLLECV